MPASRRAGDSGPSASIQEVFPTGKGALLLREVGFRLGELGPIGARAADLCKFGVNDWAPPVSPVACAERAAPRRPSKRFGEFFKTVLYSARASAGRLSSTSISASISRAGMPTDSPPS